MPIRPNPHDTPKRTTTWRRGKIRTRIGAAADGYAYIVDFPLEGTELAFSHAVYEVDDTVHARWRNEAATWWIDGGLVFNAYSYVYTDNNLNGSPQWLRIREMLPDADQITRPWDNEPQNVGIYNVNAAAMFASDYMIIREAAWSPDGTQVAVAWYPVLGGVVQDEAHVARWAVNSQTARTWGDLIEDFNVSAALGGVGTPTSFSRGGELTWSPDGRFLMTVAGTEGSGPRYAVVLGGADTPALSLVQEDHPLDGPLQGVISISPDGLKAVIGRFPDVGAANIGRFYSRDATTGVITYVEDIIVGNIPEGNYVLTAAWTLDSGTLFVGWESGATGFELIPVALGTLAAIPILAGPSLGALVYEQRQDTRPTPGYTAGATMPETDGIDLHEDGEHLVVLASSMFYVVPWTGAWGVRSSITLPDDAFQLYWLDDEFVILSAVSNGRWRSALDTTVYNSQPVAIAEPEGSAEDMRKIVKHPRPPRGVKARLPAPFPALVPAVSPLA